MHIFDPERFAVGGVIGRGKEIEGKPYAIFGKVREITLDPDDLPIRLLSFSLADMRRAVHAFEDIDKLIRVDKAVTAGELPAPSHTMLGGHNRTEDVYLLPEAEAVFDYMRARSRLRRPETQALAKARAKMLERIAAANTEFTETIE